MTTEGPTRQDAELAQLRQENELLRASAHQSSQELELLRAERQQLLDQLQAKTREMDSLQHQLQQLLRRLFGRSAEKLDPAQLLLFEKVLDQIAPKTITAPVETESTEAEKSESSEPSKGHGRRRLPADLPRQKVIHDLPEAEKPCPCCGKMRHVIGQEVSEQIEYVPAKVTVIEHVRLKYACPECHEKAAEAGPQIVTAEKPLAPIEKGLAAPGLLAYIIVSKYGDHRVQGEAVSEMREGLSWSGDRTRPQTSPNCGGQEPLWETSGAKGVTRSRQVRSVKSNASEPLMTCRKRIPLTPKLGSGDCPRISMRRSLYPAHAASGAKTARAQIRLGHGTLEPVALMPREKSKRTTREDESTKARHRGGTTRSSDEGRVMRLERRGRVIQTSDNRSTASAGGAHG